MLEIRDLPPGRRVARGGDAASEAPRLDETDERQPILAEVPTNVAERIDAALAEDRVHEVLPRIVEGIDDDGDLAAWIDPLLEVIVHHGRVFVQVEELPSVGRHTDAVDHGRGRGAGEAHVLAADEEEPGIARASGL